MSIVPDDNFYQLAADSITEKQYYLGDLKIFVFCIRKWKKRWKTWRDRVWNFCRRCIIIGANSKKVQSSWNEEGEKG